MGRTPEGIPYLVMELLEGWSLGRIIEERGRLPTLTAITIAVEALRTLAAVHEKGIVHRDLKPDNIYLVGQVAAPQLKILDFGVSLLAAGEGAARLTQAGDVFGTPQYMSPEQAQGRLDIDHRSDLFTVGEILYEMVTGHPAFGGANPLAVAMAVAMCEFPPPRTHVPDIDPDLEAVIAHAMKLDPAARYQCADEFLERLVAVGRKNPRFQIGRVLDLETPSEPPAPRRERRAERRPLIPLDVADPSPTIHGAYGRLSHLDPADAVEQVLSVPPPAANGLPSSAPPARPEDPEEGKPKGDRRPGG
jgi:serine/threonine-protein kinase